MSLHVAQADLKLTVLSEVTEVVCTTDELFEMLESHSCCRGYNADLSQSHPPKYNHCHAWLTTGSLS